MVINPPLLKKPKLVLIGEAPGETEDETGIPFTGRSGEILDECLHAAGLSRQDVEIKNAVRCRPENNRDPKKKELEACRTKFLQGEIEALKDVTWVLLGAVAIREVGGQSRGVHKNRERTWTSPDGLTCWGAPHPAAIARGIFRSDQLVRVLQRASGQARTVELKDPTIPVLALDTETTGLDVYRKARPFLATTCDGKTARLFDLTQSWDRFKLHQVIKAADEILMANALFDWTMLEAIGIDIPVEVLTDVQWTAAADDSGNCPYSLERLGNSYFKQGGQHKTDLKKFIGDKTLAGGFRSIPKEILHEYAIRDAVLTYALDRHPRMVHAKETNSSFIDRERDLLRVLRAVEKRGVLVDRAAIPTAIKYLLDEAARFLSFIRMDPVVSGGHPDYNPNSHKQTAEIMEAMGFESPERTKAGNPSFGKLVLKMFNHPITDAIHDYRHFLSLANGAIDTIPKVIDRNNRLHPGYHSLGSETNRFTCTAKKESDDEKINLLGIPSDKAVRKIFKARPGFTWCRMDWSQIEMRGIAHYSRDPGLVKSYNENPLADYYKMVGKLVLGREITKEERQDTFKTMALAKGYGIGVKSLSKRLRKDIQWVKDFIAVYDAGLPGVTQFFKDTEDTVRSRGFVMAEDYPSRVEKRAAYQGVNRIVQGSCAVHLKRVLLELFDMIQGLDDVFIVHFVHDEINFEIRNDRVGYWIPKLKQVMESGWNWSVPVIAKVETGPNWGDLKEVESA